MKKNNILIVEDDPNLGKILQDYLKLKGYKITLAVDGEDGLSKFSKDNFDFIILDIMMPKKDGFSLAKDIREINNIVPILFLTAKNMKENIIKAFKLGADDYLTKPFSMEELILRMTVAKFNTDNLDELFYSIKDFESKLTIWAAVNPYSEWELNVYVGPYDFIIEVIVDDGKNFND